MCSAWAVSGSTYMMLLFCLVVRAQTIHNTTPSVWPDQRHLELDILLIWKPHSRSHESSPRIHTLEGHSRPSWRSNSLVRLGHRRSEPQCPCQSQGRHDSSQLESTSSWASMTNDPIRPPSNVDQWWRYGRAVSADGIWRGIHYFCMLAGGNHMPRGQAQEALLFQLAGCEGLISRKTRLTALTLRKSLRPCTDHLRTRMQTSGMWVYAELN